MNATKTIEKIYDQVLALNPDTVDYDVYFEKLGLDSPTEREVAFFRVALLVAAKAVK